MEKGVFTISIDFEFAWGYVDQAISAEQKKHIKNEVEVTKRLVSMFEKYDIPVTWAIVSKLLAKGDDVIWSDTENLIPLIKNSKIHHEIGSHSYSHMIYGAKDTNLSMAEEDINNAKELHQINKLDFKSFVFPRNSEGYHDELKRAGVVSFRTHKKPWYYFLPGPFRRAFNMLSYFFPVKVLGLPQVHSSGLIAIPGGILFLGRNGLRRIIPPSLLINKAKRSLEGASKERKIFHLWFHPSNFSYETEVQFSILEEILKEVALLRDKGQIKIMTMNQIATEFKNTNKISDDKAVSSHHLNAGIFANRYKIYDKNPYENAFTYDRKRLFNFLFEYIDKNVKNGSRILDVGSGTGYFLNALQKRGFEVIGVEPAIAMRENALTDYPNLKIIEGTIKRLPFPDQTFDAVSAIEVFRYLNTTDQEAGYRECLRVLKPGGTLIATLVNKYALDGFYIKYKFFALLEKLGIKELPNYCSFTTPFSIKHFLVSRLKIKSDSLNVFGALFAPIRIIYKISGSFGESLARKLEKFDNNLTNKKWNKKFAGYLILVIKK